MKFLHDLALRCACAGGTSLILLLGSLSGLAHGAELSFAEALALALREAPALVADQVNVQAARQTVVPAGELPDPQLLLGIDNLPVDTADRFRVDRDSMTMRRIGLSQELPNRARLAARVSQAESRVGMAEAETRVTQLTVLRNTASAWIARHTAELHLSHIEHLRTENHLFAETVKAQLAGGSGRAEDVVAPRQEAVEIELLRDKLLATRERAIAQLRRYIGAAAESPLLGDVPEWTLDDETLRLGLQHHPEVESFEPAAELLDAEVAEAEASRRPDWAVELAYQRRGSQFSNMMSFQLSFDLPLWQGSRQSPLIAARRAERMALDSEREAVRREYQAELESALAELARLDSNLRRQHQSLIPLADEKVALTLASWRGGVGSLDAVVAARRERIDIELQTITLTGERQQLATDMYLMFNDPDGNRVGESQ
ncbi:MAG: TolC family protein [Pseudomonadales bacterium]|nr:TolC family protein [Pseudomonadales bacterium]